MIIIAYIIFSIIVLITLLVFKLRNIKCEAEIKTLNYGIVKLKNKNLTIECYYEEALGKLEELQKEIIGYKSRERYRKKRITSLEKQLVEATGNKLINRGRKFKS